MRLSKCVNKKYRHALVAMWSCLLVACGGSGGQAPIVGTPSVAIAPQVMLTAPTTTAPIVTGVATTLQLTAKFSRDMAASSLNASSFQVACPAGTPIAGTVTYDAANRLATLQHATNFPVSTTCVATITTAAQDAAGIHLETDYVWGFSTGTAPRVILTTPARAVPIVTGMATNTALTAKFSRDMAAASLTASSFTVACPAGTPIAGTVSYDAVNQLATLQHALNFPFSTTCEATITTAAKDTDSVALATDYVWRFTTGAAVDSTPPTVIANNPANGATGVCLSQSVSVTFSEPMDPATITAVTFNVSNPLNVTLPGVITYDTLSNTATFAVTNPPGFAASTLYTSRITTGAKDLAGNALNAANTVNFTTGTASCTPAPTVNLRSIVTYGAFGGGAGATNSGINTVVNGDLGTTAACTLFTGFHDASNSYTEVFASNIGQVTGNIYCAPPAPGTTLKLALATQAAADALIAYNALAAKTPSALLGPISGELGGLTVTSGTYRPSASTFMLTSGNLTLDAGGDPNAMWVFQVPTSLTVGLIATPRSVLLINAAQAKNVFWQVGTAARIENGSTMVGTIIASAGVTISTAGEALQTTLTGRAIGLNASVTMVNTTIVLP